jgi:hypothetical protein
MLTFDCRCGMFLFVESYSRRVLIQASLVLW